MTDNSSVVWFQNIYRITENTILKLRANAQVKYAEKLTSALNHQNLKGICRSGFVFMFIYIEILLDVKIRIHCPLVYKTVMAPTEWGTMERFTHCSVGSNSSAKIAEFYQLIM